MRLPFFMCAAGEWRAYRLLIPPTSAGFYENLREIHGPARIPRNADARQIIVSFDIQGVRRAVQPGSYRLGGGILKTITARDVLSKGAKRYCLCDGLHPLIEAAMPKGSGTAGHVRAVGTGLACNDVGELQGGKPFADAVLVYKQEHAGFYLLNWNWRRGIDPFGFRA